MTHSCQNTYSSCGMPGIINFISSLTSFFPDVMLTQRQITQPVNKAFTSFLMPQREYTVLWPTFGQWTTKLKFKWRFLAARSGVVPVCQQSSHDWKSALPTLVNLHITSITYWMDSTTVLNWLQSEFCRYKVFFIRFGHSGADRG